MPGRNLFESYSYYGRAERTSSICVFISHKSEDKPMARAVASALLDMGVDIYFDENDKMLRSAAASGNDQAIVKCIEDGLDRSTHLIGLITKRTFSSWWVPYEIGGANGRNRVCGHLVASDVDRLPSYVTVAPLLLDTDDLAGWISEGTNRSKTVINEAVTYNNRTLLKTFIPEYRAKSRITFY